VSQLQEASRHQPGIKEDAFSFLLRENPKTDGHQFELGRPKLMRIMNIIKQWSDKTHLEEIY
jgi:hypothetical protein